MVLIRGRWFVTILLGLAAATAYAAEPQAIELWRGGAPGSEGKSGIRE